MPDEIILFTIQEIADRLRVKEVTIRRLIASRELPCFVVGHQYRISEAHFQEYLRRNTIQPKEKE